jgi:hypothetical protein
MSLSIYLEFQQPPLQPPINNTRVEDAVFVRGTAQNIGGEYFLWLTLFDYNANRHCPHHGPVVVSSDGQWEMTAFFGSSGSNEA